VNGTRRTIRLSAVLGVVAALLAAWQLVLDTGTRVGRAGVGGRSRVAAAPASVAPASVAPSAAASPVPGCLAGNAGAVTDPDERCGPVDHQPPVQGSLHLRGRRE